MKKCLSLVLALLLVMSLAAPAAFAASEADAVTILRDDALLLHSQGMDINLCFPYGWKGFGQDYYGQQSDFQNVSRYQDYFSNATDLIDFMVENELHLFCQTPEDGLFYLELITDSISTSVWDLNAATASERSDLLRKMQNGNSDAVVKLEVFGSNQVLTFDWGDQLLYEMIAEGVMLDFRLESDVTITASQKSDMAYVLSTVRINDMPIDEPSPAGNGSGNGNGSGWTTVRPGGSSAGRDEEFGYNLGALSGHWSDENYYIRGNQWTHAFLLDSIVYDCVTLTMDFTLTDYTGYPWGSWYLYARDERGNWAHIGEFSIAEGSKNQTVTYKFDFDEPETFDALALQSRVANEFTISWMTSFYDARIQAG